MKKQIKNSLENNIFNLGNELTNNDINPSMISHLNHAFELSVRLDIINKIVIIIEEKKSYIFNNKINSEISQSQIKILDDIIEVING
jgi:hypothetical protein